MRNEQEIKFPYEITDINDIVLSRGMVRTSNYREAEERVSRKASILENSGCEVKRFKIKLGTVAAPSSPIN
jgi:hypothetical protein